MRRFAKLSMLTLIGLASFVSCKKSEMKSSTTGWNYNDQKWGGFEKLNYEGQATGPNLVLVEGGTYTMGLTEQDVTYEWNNVPRRVTVSSFYMDETEVANIDYREYVFWTYRVLGTNYPKVWAATLPDTLVWREELAYNEPFVETYFRHPAYDNYPVVGVTWKQATEFCKWRSDRVNEMILIEKGILNPNPEQVDADNFNTDAYLVGQYQGSVKKNLKDHTTGGERPVKFEDGIMQPNYRLPTEAEWEYAALALQGNLSSKNDEIITNRRTYPWNGEGSRSKRHDKYQGRILANFKLGGGDYMGVAGNLNDHAHITAPVRSYMPNDFGLYNMAGNVNEWVADVYRPSTSTTLRDVDNSDLNPFRGNVFTELEKDENGVPVEKDSLGRLKTVMVSDSAVANRDNFKRGNLINFDDGDANSAVTYDYGKTTLINDQSRVYKGGSWADRLFWLSPGARRYKDENRADKSLGFRCAMTRTGGPEGNDDAAGNYFGKGKKSPKRSYK